eukprot:TRINITY_DN69305_c0_g1_i1.p1 TRINITY_DN69305_c0_g1~~TRINITY_DN69305_c0_g1_i1.p1  ORF type:complete len:159 (-),score=36.96 TRINITY_DN69305_c0_g1_i1:125-601(-)
MCIRDRYMGKRPYQGKTRKEIKDGMMSKQASVKRADIPPGWSIESADFINKCLQRRPANRLGANGPAEVKQHIWFKDYNWKMLMEKKMKPIFVPSVRSDHSNLKNPSERMGSDDEGEKRDSLLLKKENVQNFFSGYYYNIDEIKDKKELVQIEDLKNI